MKIVLVRHLDLCYNGGSEALTFEFCVIRFIKFKSFVIKTFITYISISNSRTFFIFSLFTVEKVSILFSFLFPDVFFSI